MPGIAVAFNVILIMSFLAWKGKRFPLFGSLLPLLPVSAGLHNRYVAVLFSCNTLPGFLLLYEDPEKGESLWAIKTNLRRMIFSMMGKKLNADDLNDVSGGIKLGLAGGNIGCVGGDANGIVPPINKKLDLDDVSGVAGGWYLDEPDSGKDILASKPRKGPKIDS